MDKLNPKIIKRKAVDGLGNSGRSYYYDPSTQNMELISNPPEHISSSELKVGTPAHKLRYPQRYKSGYVDWWDRDDKLKEKIMQTRVSDRDTVYVSFLFSMILLVLSLLKNKAEPIKYLGVFGRIDSFP